MMRRLALLFLTIAAACKQSPSQPAKQPAARPQVSATVITIQTAVQPEKKNFTRTIVIVGDRARDTGEHDTWRLYDTKASTVTFVDDVGKTIRTESIQPLITRRSEALKGALPGHFATATYKRTKERKPLQGVTAGQVLIEAGAFRRELWIAEHPSIPGGLFAMMHASESLATPLAPMMRDVDESLVALRGFPLADRTSVPGVEGNLIVERTVTSIARQQVPEGVVALPRGYRDLTPKPPPAKKK